MDILETLKKNGHRITSARRNVIASFSSGCNPVTAQEVHVQLRKKGFSPNVTTVYRELQFLTEQGLLRTIQFDDGVARYELADGHHHHHLVCIRCKAVDEIEMDHDIDSLEQQIAKQKNFAVQRHSLEFYGLCSKCGA